MLRINNYQGLYRIPRPLDSKGIGSVPGAGEILCDIVYSAQEGYNKDNNSSLFQEQSQWVLTAKSMPPVFGKS